MAVRRDLFDEIGGFSEEHFTGVFGDVDFCLRLHEAGWRTAWTPYAEMIHFELPEDGRAVDGANAIRFDRDIRYLRQRWGTVDRGRPLVQSQSLPGPRIALAGLATAAVVRPTARVERQAVAAE